MNLTNFLFVPSILFMCIVAPIWIVMHYRSKGKTAQGISQEERENLDEMLATIDKLSDRVETLESILNEHHQDWHKPRASEKSS